jgi:hypothetical protein
VHGPDHRLDPELNLAVLLHLSDQPLRTVALRRCPPFQPSGRSGRVSNPAFPTTSEGVRLELSTKSGLLLLGPARVKNDRD